jgi:16S rRNA G966 N2-methylase RsmD
MTAALYYGDNLSVLREIVATESIDLIYLDPPFNSNASYNVLFKVNSRRHRSRPSKTRGIGMNPQNAPSMKS